MLLEEMCSDVKLLYEISKIKKLLLVNGARRLAISDSLLFLKTIPVSCANPENKLGAKLLSLLYPKSIYSNWTNSGKHH